jgi:hypothetical protein
MLRVVTGLMLLALADPGSCGSGSDGNTTSSPSPPQQCDTYATTWCGRSLNCYVSVGRIDQATADQSIADCETLIENKLPCSAVTATSNDYDRCISQINGMACSSWDVPQTQFNSVAAPSICRNIFTFR